MRNSVNVLFLLKFDPYFKFSFADMSAYRDGLVEKSTLLDPSSKQIPARWIFAATLIVVKLAISSFTLFSGR